MGPSKDVPGSIRAVVLTAKKLVKVVTAIIIHSTRSHLQNLPKLDTEL